MLLFFTVNANRSVFYNWLMPNSIFSSDHAVHSLQAAGHLNPIGEKEKENQSWTSCNKWTSLFGNLSTQMAVCTCYFCTKQVSLLHAERFTVFFKLSVYMGVLLNWTIEAISTFWFYSDFPSLVSHPLPAAFHTLSKTASMQLSCVYGKEKERQKAF